MDVYEGVTEYFANLFQINQGLITEEIFIVAFQTKWNVLRDERHHVFHHMSANVLKAP
jgi:predicted metalloprotease with PDZ domain